MQGVDHVQGLVHRSGPRADWRDLAGLGQGAGWANPSEERISESSINALRLKASSCTLASTGSTLRTCAGPTTSPGSDTTAGSRSTTGIRSNASTCPVRQGEPSSHSQGRSVGTGVISCNTISRANRALVTPRGITVQSIRTVSTGTGRTGSSRAENRTKGDDKPFGQPQQCRSIGSHGKDRQGSWPHVCSEQRQDRSRKVQSFRDGESRRAQTRQQQARDSWG